MFPRFKLVGTTDFWVIHPSSYLHVSCKTQNIERSPNGLPYPKLPNYVEALLDTQNGVDLADLIDAADLSEQWGEESIKLNQDIDTAWAKQQNGMQCQIYGTVRYALSEVPEPRRVLWTQVVRKKVSRVGHKRSTATHATRWRRHGSKDPCRRLREGI